MNVVKIEECACIQSLGYSYFLGRDVDSSRLYLFRQIEKDEEKWYVNQNDKEFCEELMSVRLREVESIEQGKYELENMFKRCSQVYERRRSYEKNKGDCSMQQKRGRW